MLCSACFSFDWRHWLLAIQPRAIARAGETCTAEMVAVSLGKLRGHLGGDAPDLLAGTLAVQRSHSARRVVGGWHPCWPAGRPVRYRLAGSSVQAGWCIGRPSTLLAAAAAGEMLSRMMNGLNSPHCISIAGANNGGAGRRRPVATDHLPPSLAPPPTTAPAHLGMPAAGRRPRAGARRLAGEKKRISFSHTPPRWDSNPRSCDRIFRIAAPQKKAIRGKRPSREIAGI